MPSPIHVVPKRVGRRGLAERFGGPLPSSTSQFFNEPFNFPPRGYVVERICAGDRRMRDAIRRTLREAARRDRPFDLQLTFGALLRECAAERRTEDWIRAWRDAEPAELVRAVLTYALGEAGPRPMTPAPGLTPDLDELARRAGEPAEDDAAAVLSRDALVELAHHDRPRAVALVRRLLALDAALHVYRLPVARALDQFPAPGDLERWLAAQGLLAAPARRNADGCWVEAILARAARLVSFDRDELYEDLLYRFAAIARDVLGGVHFEELPPEASGRYERALAHIAEPPDPSAPPPVLLWAHDHECSYATVVQPGELDLTAVRHLLDRVLAARGSALRVARVITDRPRVLAGDEQGLYAAAERELLLLEL